jgi:hypothetical protein
VAVAEIRTHPDTWTEAMVELGTRPDTWTVEAEGAEPAVAVEVEELEEEEPAEDRRPETLAAARGQDTTGCLGVPEVPPGPACLPISPAGDCHSDNRSDCPGRLLYRTQGRTLWRSLVRSDLPSPPPFGRPRRYAVPHCVTHITLVATYPQRSPNSVRDR